MQSLGKALWIPSDVQTALYQKSGRFYCKRSQGKKKDRLRKLEKNTATRTPKATAFEVRH